VLWGGECELNSEQSLLPGFCGDSGEPLGSITRNFMTYQQLTEYPVGGI
jgi:hypothetical protein